MTLAKERFPNPRIIQPTGYLWPFLGAVHVADALGWYNPNRVPKGQIQSRYMHAQLYLPGRYLQIVFGVLLLVTMGLLTTVLCDEKTTVFSGLLMAVCPAFIGVSHFSHTNLPVTTMSFLSLTLLLWDQQCDTSSRTMIRAAAFVGGLACAIKYSAFPLLIPLLYRSWMREKKLTFCLDILAWVGFAFSLGCPFVWITPHLFFKGFFSLAAWVKEPVPGVINGFLFPLRYSFPYSLGPLLAAFSLVAVLWALYKNDSKKTVLLLWIGAFVVGVYRSGVIASPGRMVIAAPVLVFLVSAMLSSFYDQSKNYRPVIVLSAITLFLSTLLMALTVVRLHSALPIQKQASNWIWAHIPPGTPIGVLEQAYYWTPDILYPDNPDLVGYKPPYPLVITGESIEKARTLEYILITSRQRAYLTPAFRAWLESGQEFTVVHQFLRDLSWGAFTWHREECPFGMTEDDLSVYSLTLFKRSSRYR